MGFKSIEKIALNEKIAEETAARQFKEVLANLEMRHNIEKINKDAEIFLMQHPRKK